MKKVLIAAFLMSSMVTLAQDEKTYTDEELTKYATVMVWAESEKSSMTGIYNGWINNDDVLKAPRFVEIKKTKGDSVKLQEIAVTLEEKQAFDMIISSYDSMTSSFKEVYTSKIKEDIGAGLYNSLRKSMKKDAELKARYDAIFEEIKNNATSEEEDTEE